MVYGPWGDMAYFFFTKDIFKGKSIPVFTGHVYFIYQFFIRYCNMNRYLSISAYTCHIRAYTSVLAHMHIHVILEHIHQY
ncbi:putative UDP-glucuronate 4-epimerase [Helianthus annuus]|nr:putative UDP-glucuronate 4-epimerase [Helianthus annuus]